MCPDPRHSEELDQAVVRSETRRPAHLQNPQKWPVGGNGAAQRLRADRETLQEGRLLLQALPPAGAVHLGRQGHNTPFKILLNVFYNVVFYLSLYIVFILFFSYFYDVLENYFYLPFYIT